MTGNQKSKIIIFRTKTVNCFNWTRLTFKSNRKGILQILVIRISIHIIFIEFIMQEQLGQVALGVTINK